MSFNPLITSTVDTLPGSHLFFWQFAFSPLSDWENLPNHLKLDTLFFRQLKAAFLTAHRNSTASLHAVKLQLRPLIGVDVALNKLPDLFVPQVPHVEILSIIGGCC